jgi:hypothetical protein
MATEIRIRRPDDERIIEMEAWLRDNIGLGSYRTNKNTWLGVEDWFYYDDWPDWPEDGEELEDDEAEADLIFTFRRDADATMFALKWTTTTV